jgi:hypothetical protein
MSGLGPVPELFREPVLLRFPRREQLFYVPIPTGLFRISGGLPLLSTGGPNSISIGPVMGVLSFLLVSP